MKTRSVPLRWLVALSLVGLIASCGSDDTSGPEPEDPVIAGMAIRESGVTVVSISGTDVVGSIDIPEGSTSALLTMVFVSENGGEILPTATEIMGAAVDDEAVARFTQMGTFTGRIQAVTIGETTLVVRFIRDGIVVYESPPVPVSVFGPSA
jgi:hypothetical protein